MDKYQRLRKIGEGAFGKAFLVRHKGNNRQCVVKEINIVRMLPKEREEARKEVAVLAQLKHPNIVAYIESFEESGTLHIVMNYCAGGDLYSKINSQRGVLFAEEQIWNWFVQICLAMKHIHDRKILHRDIKSQNIFLTTSGAVQLGDFGIAKVLNNTVELARTCIGTPYYLSPEIVENKPYNNKSDIWSLGCVLYELTTHKHAFEAGNMKNLVLKIIRGSYPPIPPQYSYDLRGLIAQLLKRAPRDRPSINSILQKNIIMQRVRSILSAEQIADEFSHTVMHGAKVAKALPPGPRPSSAPKKEAIQRPASAGRKYNPAAVYGRPLSARKSQGRSSGDLKKKAGPGDVGNRPLPVPGQMEWEQKKKEMLDKEQKRREDLKKQQQEEGAQRHKNLLEKQKMDRINKSKEEGWKNLVDSLEDNKESPQSPQAGGDARPLPIPKQLEPAHPNFLENRKPRQPGKYEEYHMYLDKLKNQRIEREKALDQRAAEYMQAPKLPAQQNNNGNGNNLPSPAVYAVQQANYSRQKAAEAAERARVTEDYIMRRREAAMNKARGQAELYGYRPPSGAGKASPSPRPGQARPALQLGRNKEEQEYIQKLRQIREQNMHERRAIKHKLTADDNIGEKKEIEAEQRRKKVEALRQQADDWAKKKKDDLEQEKQKLLNKQFAADQAKRPPVAPSNRPGSARSMQPASPVSITGILQVIGVRADAAVPPAGKGQIPPQPEEPQVSSVQQKKNEILKKLNEQSPARGKWGAGGADVPLAAAENVEMRGKWGKEVVSPLAVTQAESPAPESSRPQWDKEEKLRLSAIPLEQTASQMEATSARDQVIKNPKNVGDNPCLPRNQWGRPGSTVVKVLNKLPVCEGTMTLDSDDSQEGAGNSASPGNTPPAIGSTVTLSKGPTPASVPTPVPSVRPPIRSGTITIKAADAATVSTTASSVEVEKLGEVRGKGGATSPDFVVKATATILPIATDISAQNDSQFPVGEVELPGSNRFVQSEGPDSNPLEATEDAKSDRLQTVLEVTEICSETEQFTSEDTKTVSSDKTVQTKENVPQEQANLEDEDKSTGSLKPQSPTTPVVNKKPKIPQKPRPLPKPNLLLKPEKSAISSEQGSEKPASVDVGDKTAKLEQQKTADHEKKQQLNVEERSHSVQKGLTTGNYDLKDIQMLRTCSEPDLTRLFRTITRCVQATLRRHQSLDMEEKEEAQSDDSGRETEEDDKCDVTENVSAVEKDRKSLENKDNNDEDTSEFIDDDEEELMNLRETMQSFLIDNDDDPGTPPVGTIKFSLSASGESSKDDPGRGREAVASGKKEGRGGGVGQPMPSQGSPVRSKSESLLVHGPHSGDGGDNEEVGEPEEEVPDYNVAEIFDMDDSDEETVFGDEEGDSDFDLYSRLEHQRAELEKELGFEKFIQVYKTVQALQEDEDENMEEGARIAIAMLGPDKQNLYPRIFQLVMADTAFTEDNV